MAVARYLPLIAAAGALLLARTASAQPNACEPIVAGLIEAQISFSEQQQRLRSAAASTSIADLPDADAVDERPRPTGGAPRSADKSEREAPAPRDESSRESKKSTNAAGPARYSRTNTQEAEVDEGDIVKTDGRNIYHVSCTRDRDASGCRNELRIYASWPAKQTRLLSRYTIPARGAEAAVKQLYLSGDQLVVVMPAPGPATRILVLDVRDPAQPQVAREQLVDGNFIDARMIGRQLYLATGSRALQLPPTMTQEVQALIAQALSSGRRPSATEIVDRLDPRWTAVLRDGPGLPTTRVLSASWNAAASTPAYGCADLQLADGAAQGQLLNVLQLDVDDGRVRGAGATGYSSQSTVYASEGAVYVADPTPAPSGRGWQVATRVRKFALGRGGQPRFESAGLVRGMVINSFAMSEFGGDLRIATSDHWSSNNVYVLRSHGHALDTIGALEGLAPNERIYAVRMMGARGYVVTFRRTDPLYTLDLSNPTRPAVVGELKVEGWSSYLHPLGDGHLLAVGQDADTAGRATGFHLQVFDVTDPRRPVRKFHRALAAASTSGAESDHHAFMFEPQTMTLSLPWKSEGYYGLVAFKVDPREGFVDLGRVNHALMFKQYFQKQCARTFSDRCDSAKAWYGFVTRPAIAVDRVIAIDDQLYSLSPAGLMVHQVGRRLSLTTSVLVAEPSWRSSPRPVASRW